VGAYADQLSNARGAGLTNYDIAYANGSLTIGKAALTVAGKTSTTVYTGLLQMNGFTVQGLYGADRVTAVAGLASGTHAGTYADHLSDARGAGLSNYDIAYVDGALTIGKTSLVVTVNSDQKTFDAVPYAGGAGVSYRGFVNGETAATLGGTLTYGGSSQGAVQPGAYSLTASGLASGDYAIDYVGGTLTIRPLPRLPIANLPTLSVVAARGAMQLLPTQNGAATALDWGVDMKDKAEAPDHDHAREAEHNRERERAARR